MSRAGSRKGKGFSSTDRTIVNIAVLAPIPSAITSTTASVNPGARRNVRATYRKFRSISSSGLTLFHSHKSSRTFSLLPNLTCACRRASPADIPRAKLSSISSAICALISSANSESSVRRRKNRHTLMRHLTSLLCALCAPTSAPSVLNLFSSLCAFSLFSLSHHSSNRRHHLLPPARLRRQSFPPRRRQLVILRLTIVLARSPVRRQPALIFQPVQRRI